ncbi:hypothetical protein COV87_02260 [Candidatus Roizmanbacteria bacterium CG11_big_fil_rev_8_21_14_0_20_37_16]|uniref:Uncharacterized protein n=1 Tax=Candidatus Roizmanbacteria bacterium CG11_big_fil_rev_8_21_14_0_20_37_16 TaxID=1974857 RepID=A0A2H0KK87_9BACT|nr:MAG: hypothetical protein COV87_02260 [Candidatus Roizmanbacteria bacterium CG11_big_fil_rev_8_21_14_0_20_37_16]
MSSPLERGKNQEIKQMNNRLITNIGNPLVDQAYVGFDSGKIPLGGLFEASGSMLPIHTLQVQCYGNHGYIKLENGGLSTADFSYKPSRELGADYLDCTVETFRYEGSGLGTSLLHMGLHLLECVGPQLEQENVIGLIADVAEAMNPSTTSSRKRWTTAAIEGFGYAHRGNLFAEGNINQNTGLVFLKRIK